MGQNYNFPEQGMWGVEGYLEDGKTGKTKEANDTWYNCLKPEITNADCIQFITALQFPSGFWLQARSFHIPQSSRAFPPFQSHAPCSLCILVMQWFNSRPSVQEKQNNIHPTDLNIFYLCWWLLSEAQGYPHCTLFKPGFRSLLPVSSNPCTTPDSAQRIASRVLWSWAYICANCLHACKIVLYLDSIRGLRSPKQAEARCSIASSLFSGE